MCVLVSGVAPGRFVVLGIARVQPVEAVTALLAVWSLQLWHSLPSTPQLLTVPPCSSSPTTHEVGDNEVAAMAQDGGPFPASPNQLLRGGSGSDSESSGSEDSEDEVFAEKPSVTT